MHCPFLCLWLLYSILEIDHPDSFSGLFTGLKMVKFHLCISVHKCSRVKLDFYIIIEHLGV